MIETAILDAWDDDARRALAARQPIGRLGRPQDIAAAVGYLADPRQGSSPAKRCALMAAGRWGAIPARTRGCRVETVDLVVVGSGAAGLLAALAAYHLGLSVLVLETTPFFGGSTAVSGGTWIPNNPHQVATGKAEPPGQALEYLRAEVGNHGNPALWHAFLAAGPHMVAFMESQRGLHFGMRTLAPDYQPDQPGAAPGYRVRDPQDFDGRALGRHLHRLRPHKAGAGHWSMSPDGNTGDGAAMAQTIGARLGDANAEPLFYAPGFADPAA